MKKLLITIILLLCPLIVNAGELNITAIDFYKEGYDPTKTFGDATLIESKGEYLLMDTGSSSINNLIIDYLKEHGINHLSLYLSHIHQDHLGKLVPIINDDYFTIEKLYLPNLDYINNYLDQNNESEIDYSFLDGYRTTYNSIKDAALAKNISVIELSRGSSFNIGDARAKVIWQMDSAGKLDPESYRKGYINNNSLVVMMQVDNTKFLTAGDIERETETEILESNIDIKADIFKLSHHGSNTSNIEAFTNKVGANYIFYEFSGDTETSIAQYNSVKDNVNRLQTQSNIYSVRYNGTTTFNINNDHITVNPTRNYVTIKVKYIDDAKNEIIKIKDYKFNKATQYHLKNFVEDIEGYKLVNESGKKLEYHGAANALDTEYEVHYKKTKFKISTKVNGNGGKIEGDEEVYYGEDSTANKIKITAANGYLIDKVTINGKEIETNKEETLTLSNLKNVKENYLIEVSFKSKFGIGQLVKVPSTLAVIPPYILIIGIILVLLSVSSIVYINRKK